MYGVGHYLLIRGLEMAPASRLSPFLYTQIIWATLFGVIFFGQFPDGITIAGAAVVIASGPTGDNNRRASNRDPVRKLAKEDHPKQRRPYDLGIEKR